MKDNTATSGGWMCPACDRRVPGHVGQCRCGYTRQAAEGDADEPGAARPAPSTGVIVVAVIGVLAAAFVLNHRTAPAIPPAIATAPAAGASKAGAAGPKSAPQEPAAAPRIVPLPAIESPSPGTAPPPPAAAVAQPASPSSFEDVVNNALPAVVLIQTSVGRGSGFFVSPDTIITNAHVAGSDAYLTIRRADGETSTARVDTVSPGVDLAVLKVSSPSPTQRVLALGSAAGVRVGAEVIAIGSPLGVFQNSVTRGIVSGLRQFGAVTLVQTDAAVNPGNSGGPLLDRGGRVVGITTLGVNGGQGLSFAVAADYARSLLEGGPTTAAAGATPLASLNEALQSGGAASDSSEAARDRATRTYEQAMTQIARRADALDDYWRSFVTACYRGQVAGSFGRGWFAIFDQRAMQGAVAPGCEGEFADLQTRAREIRDAVLAADEAARRADVLPGVRRDLRQRDRLDYAGWGR